ncbi:MAG TPA: glycosyltransferase family 39 protein [Candidatus Binatia bacterium]|nr:glycosyltransferase family 39 protein [Candidatus Binatia bacterium]
MAETKILPLADARLQPILNPSGPEPSRSRWHTAGPALAAASVCLLFGLLWWNRFLGVTNEGWHFFFAQQILHGKVPYRDFYLFVPPLLQLETAAIIKVFGEHLIVTQFFGLAQAAILAFALYCWMARVFPPFESMLATVLTVCLCMANRTEELYALHMSALFHTVLAAWLATAAVNSRGIRLKYAFWGGVLSGLAFLAKQTSGVAIIAALPVLLGIVAWRLFGARKATLLLAIFVAGCVIPIALASAWLASQSALSLAISDLFIRGTSSKGPPSQMLSRLIMFAAENSYLRAHLFLAAVILLTCLLLCGRRLIYSGPRKPAASRGALTLTALLAFCILAGWALSYWHRFHLAGPLTELPQETGAFLAEFGSLILVVLSGWMFFTRRLGRDQIQFFLLAGISFAVAFLGSLSWPTSTGMLLPSLTFVTAALLGALRQVPSGRFLRPVAILCCLVLMVQICWQKFTTPFSWGDWKEPDVHHATETLNYPELRGYHVSPQTADFVTRVTDAVDSHSRPDQPIFVYPNLPVFYLLSHRSPETFGYVHFVDVAPDFVDLRDADTLRRHPPAVIVLLEPSEQELRMGERYFRGGRRSAQRDLLAAIEEIRPQYDLLQRIPTGASNQIVDVFALRATK